VLQLSYKDFLLENKQRASNWILYSFSNSHCLEDHLTLNDYHVKPHEMVEVCLCTTISREALMQLLFKIHRRGRYIAQPRQLYQQPYFDSLVYHGRQKGRLKPGEKRSTRSLSVRSSSSSINIKAAMTMSPSSTSRQPSLKTKFSGESFEDLNDSSRVQGHSRFGAGTEDEIGVTVTKPETPSPPSARAGSMLTYSAVVRPTSIAGS
jgi:hypothetical protein